MGNGAGSLAFVASSRSRLPPAFSVPELNRRPTCTPFPSPGKLRVRPPPLIPLESLPRIRFRGCVFAILSAEALAEEEAFIFRSFYPSAPTLSS